MDKIAVLIPCYNESQLIQKSKDRKSKLTEASRERYARCEYLMQKSVEDHPGAAPIKPGRHRYRLNEWYLQKGWNRGILFIVPEQSKDCSGFFYGGKKNENHIKRRFSKRIC